MAAVAFPNVKPTSRSYNAGEFPQTVFEAQNGATSVVRFGNRRVNSELNLTFANISDEDAEKILSNYERVNRNWDHVTFSINDGAVGSKDGLQFYFRERDSGLRWRYAEPPTVQSVFPGISTVSCRFQGFLDG